MDSIGSTISSDRSDSERGRQRPFPKDCGRRTCRRLHGLAFTLPVLETAAACSMCEVDRSELSRSSVPDSQL